MTAPVLIKLLEAAVRAVKDIESCSADANTINEFLSGPQPCVLISDGDRRSVALDLPEEFRIQAAELAEAVLAHRRNARFDEIRAAGVDPSRLIYKTVLPLTLPEAPSIEIKGQT